MGSMILSIFLGLLTGAGFGVVLHKVGATRYSRVMGMLTVRDTKVMKFVFATIGTASILYGLAATTGLAEGLNLVPRVMPYLGGAHLLGGALFGAALGWTGLCPGTCVAKAGGRGGDKKFAAAASVVGLVVGIVVYALVKQPLMEAGVIAANQKPLTLHGLLGLPYGTVALIFAAVMFAVVFAVDRLTTEKASPASQERRSLLDMIRGEWSWLAAGLVGGTLVVLATAQGGYLGFSGAALAAVGAGAHALHLPFELVPRIDADIAWRAALIVGVFPGAILARVTGLTPAAAAQAPVAKVLEPKAIAVSFASGVMMSAGAMIGGGCTTGAFLAGWPTLSVGSFAMAGTFFAVSMAVSNLRLVTRRFDLPQLQLRGDRVYD